MFSQENLSENMVILVGNNVGYIQSFISSDALANPGKHLEDNIEFLLEKMHREMPRLESSL